MALTTYLTTASGPGSAAAQTVPSRSLGGYASTTAWTGGAVGDLFGRASTADVADARSDYRCVFVYNPSTTVTVSDLRAYITPRTDGAQYLFCGVDPRPAGYLDALSPQAVEVATSYIAPAGVTFANPTTYAAGVALGTLPPTTGRAVWFKRLPTGAEGAPADNADVTFQDSTATATVRQIFWETEPYADKTKYSLPQTYTPTPSPFRRVLVDFLVAGGSRITWQLDQTMVDCGPYDFQLQASHSGVAAAADWIDVGPPGRDALYLLDPDKRLWGMTATLHYRVVLTTGVGTYVSQPANVFGRLSQEQWLQAREIARKEQLRLRQFVGMEGYLLKARRYGPPCTCVDPVTYERNTSACLSCWGTGITGGYHEPVPLTFANMANPTSREKVAYNENLGTVRPITVEGRMIADIPISSGDVWIGVTSDERYYAHATKDLVARNGVPIVVGVEWRLAARTEVLYAYQLTRPTNAQPDYRNVENLVI